MKLLRSQLSVGGLVAILVLGLRPSSQITLVAQNAPTWTAPRTSWGAPDLQGIWDYRTATPLERPAEFKGQEFLTDEEVAAYEHRAATRSDGRPPDDPRTAPSVHAPEWLDYGKTVVGTRRTSLVTLPPDGRIPPLSDEGQHRAESRQAERSARGPAGSYASRSLWERCITRGLPNGMLPAGYNNNVQLLQTPSVVVIFNEMIHDARIIPLDGRPHLDDSIRQWRGDSRAWWEDDTLVIETTNFSKHTDFRGASNDLHLIERFRRTGPKTVSYEFTVTDPTTWTSPWTVTFPMTRTTDPVYEYACHEGNYGLLNILTVARSTTP